MNAQALMFGVPVLLFLAGEPGGAMLIGLLLLVVWGALRKPKAPATRGSARLGDYGDAKQAGLFSDHPESVVLGRATWLAAGTNGNQLLKLQRFTHLASFSKTGGGKGVGVVIPNALHWPKSLVVTDKGGEVFATASAWRERAFGQPQYLIDPLHIQGKPGACYNPCDGIYDDRITFFDDCRALANLIVFRKGTELEPHWNDSSELILTAFIAFVCACETNRAERNLITVKRLLASPKTYADSVKVMQQITSHHGVVAELGNKISWFIDKELSSVLSSTNRHLAFLSSPAVAATLASSSFDPKELRSDIGASVYLTVVPTKTEIFAPLNRVLLGSLLHAAAQALPSERNKVLFLIDEAGNLGRIPALMEATTLLRGVGIRLWFIFQSLNQVREVYGESAQTFLDNIDVQQFFSVRSYETAKTIADRIGDATIGETSTTDTDSVSHQHPALGSDSGSGGSSSKSHAITRNWIARKVLFPDEILRLPENVALLFVNNLPVLPVKLPRYYEDPEFSKCLAIGRNPSRPLRQARKLASATGGLAHFIVGLVIALALVLAMVVYHHGNGLLAARPGPSNGPSFGMATAERQAIAEAEAEIESLQRRIAEAEQAAMDRVQLDALKRHQGTLQAQLKRLTTNPPSEAKKAIQSAPEAETPPSLPARLSIEPAPQIAPSPGRVRAPGFDGQPGAFAYQSASTKRLEPDCPDPARCPHSADPVRLHFCLDPAWCPDLLRCPHRGGIYYRR